MARVPDDNLSLDEVYEGRLYVDRLLNMVPAPERDEVISILGQDIVERNEVGGWFGIDAKTIANYE